MSSRCPSARRRTAARTQTIEAEASRWNGAGTNGAAGASPTRARMVAKSATASPERSHRRPLAPRRNSPGRGKHPRRGAACRNRSRVLRHTRSGFWPGSSARCGVPARASTAVVVERGPGEAIYALEDLSEWSAAQSARLRAAPNRPRTVGAPARRVATELLLDVRTFCGGIGDLLGNAQQSALDPDEVEDEALAMIEGFLSWTALMASQLGIFPGNAASCRPLWPDRWQLLRSAGCLSAPRPPVPTVEASGSPRFPISKRMNYDFFANSFCLCYGNVLAGREAFSRGAGR